MSAHCLSPPGGMEWLRGDMHNHCERFDLLDEHFGGVDKRLDFLAFTNHAQKPIFFHQHEMIARGRELLPGIPVFFGMEWNAPEGRHAGVVFPPSSDEADHAYSFSRAHDRHVDGSNPDVDASMERLSGKSEEERPVLFFNHPAPDDWSAPVIQRYLGADGGGVACGIEAVHGHQALAKTLERWDLATYPGCAPGGLADSVYERGRPFSLLANSDFHVHKQERDYDFPMGIFNHSLVGVPVGDRSPQAILAALRAGRTCASQGFWMKLDELSVGAGSEAKVGIGGTWQGTGAGAVLRIRLDSDEEVGSVTLIGRLATGDSSSVLVSFGPQPAGPLQLEFAVPPGACGHLRLRVVSASVERPAPSPPGPKGFFTSAILLENA